MPLPAGTRIGGYEVTGVLGAGGMGEVYRARDTKLNRDVALKILPAAFAADPDRLARFRREAQVLASLNHPNIAAIYGLEDSGETHALVMELVDGLTLAEVIQGQRIDDALPIARQIAEALEAAHEKGIVHRDLKPANVKVTGEGVVKVLDFGLAKAIQGDGSRLREQDPSPSFVTMTSPAMTEIGVILGTAGYMSPEQAKGKPADRRADIWALGVVLFEMLSGRALYRGETVTETIAQVITQPPAWDALPVSTPPSIRRLLRRMLEKDPRNRLQSAGDVRIEIDECLRAPSEDAEAAPAPIQGKRHRVVVAAMLLALGALAGAAIRSALMLTNSEATSRSPLHLSITIPADLRVRDFRITPDGNRIVVRALPRDSQRGRPRFQLYVRDFASYEFKPIAGTEGVQNFAFSSEGRWLAVIGRVGDGESDRQLIKVPIDGSAPPVVLAHWSATGSDTIACLDNGDMLTIAADGDRQTIVRIPADGGAPAKPIPIQHDSRWTPRWLGRSVTGGMIFVQLDGFGPRGYQTNVGLLDPASGAITPVVENAGDPVYVDGHVVFSRDDTLMSVPFDLDRRATSGQVTALSAGLRGIVGPAPFSLAENGTLAYVPGGSSEFTRQLVVIEPGGRVTPFIEEGQKFAQSLNVSPDGRRAAVTVMTQEGTYETWVADPSRAAVRRTFAHVNADVSGAVWSPDSQRLAYYREGNDKDDGVYMQRADAQGPAERLSAVTKKEILIPTDWLPDGSGLLVMMTGPGRNFDLLLLPFPSGGQMQAAKPLRATGANESWGAISPDGRRLAFLSDESGPNEVYVAAFDKGVVGPPQIVSNDACGRARWSSDGRHLYFCAATPARLVRVEVKSTPALSVGEPVQVADLAALRINPVAWDVLRDGRILAVQRNEAEDSLASVNVILNWNDELRRRVVGRK